ncbi:MAG: type II toxin-antitoxin system VapB family antitoxin, partial [Mycobacteriales bacterium]
MSASPAVIASAITVTDLLIRGLDADDLERLDTRARRLGLSRGEYIRRRLHADARPLIAVSLSDLERFARELPDLADDKVMA